MKFLSSGRLRARPAPAQRTELGSAGTRTQAAGRQWCCGRSTASSIRKVRNRIGIATGHGNAWTQERVRGFRNHHEIAGHRDGEWAERGEITLEAAAKIVGVLSFNELKGCAL
jgi:hypothetical protein